ncbi:hypothetical protein LY76DRAFT_354272 [Colletotrichum caudatum]|nr:hypothetical protein LY76DRAFT_354272 [Colletotrichum caudatum]
MGSRRRIHRSGRRHIPALHLSRPSGEKKAMMSVSKGLTPTGKLTRMGLVVNDTELWSDLHQSTLVGSFTRSDGRFREALCVAYSLLAFVISDISQRR